MVKEGENMLEKDFQALFIAKVKEILPGAIPIKNDSRYRQGIPDWLVIYKDKALFFEIKAAKNASLQPNQWYYIQIITDNGGFARMVYPENYEEVLNEIQQSFRP